MKINLLLRPPKDRTTDHWHKLWAVYYVGREQSRLVEVYLFRLLPYFLIGTILTYFGLALILFVWISRKPEKDIGYSDVLVMPFDWSGFQEKRGRIFIETGQQNIRDQKFQEGVMKIRIGLAKYPYDREARIYLAQIYYSAGLFGRAHDLMKRGIELGLNDLEFLTSFFKICYDSERFQSVVDVSEILLADEVYCADPENVFFVNRHKVTGLIEINRLDEAYVLAHKVNTDPNGRYRMVDAEFLSLLKAEKPIEALILLEQWRFRTGPDNMQLNNMFILAYIAMEDNARLHQSIDDLLNRDPLNPDLHILAMQNWNRAGMQDELEAAFATYMLHLGWEPDNLIKLANFLTSVRQISLVEEILRETRQQGLKEDVILFNLLYAYLTDGRWDEAKGVLDLLNSVLHTFEPIDRKLVGIGETIILLKQERRDNLSIILLQELRRIRASINFYMTVGNILMESELYDVAVETLDQGMATFPGNNRIAEAYTKATHAAFQFAEDNKPNEVEETLEFGPEEYLKKLDSMIKNKEYDLAEDLLTHIFRIDPQWLLGRGEDFEYRKLQLYYETRDSQLHSQTTSLFLSNNPDRGPELLQLALNYLSEGKAERSRIIAKEIVRNDPLNRPAKQLLVELEGPDSAETTNLQESENQEKLPSKNRLIEDLENALDEKEMANAEELILKVLGANPSWLSGSREEIDLLHIRYYIESGDFPPASSLIRIFMGSDARSARELLDLAKKYNDREMSKETQFLMSQIQREFPEMSILDQFELRPKLEP